MPRRVRSSPRFNRLGCAMAGVAMVCFVGACGVTTDDSVREIDIPAALAATSTTTTTTTRPATTTTTSIAPPSTDAPTTSSTIPVEATMRSVRLYFVANDRFYEERREVFRTAEPRQILEELIRGPLDPLTPFAATTSLAFDDILAVRILRGLAVVQVSPRVGTLDFPEKVRFAGQVVLTLTELPGVGQVQFEVDGDPLDLPEGDGGLPDGPLARESFENLIERDIFGPDGSTPTGNSSGFPDTIPIDGPGPVQ
jgi:spore germination protein GerM